MDTVETMISRFEYAIQKRGYAYYKDGMVSKVTKDEDLESYTAVVEGSNDNEYTVTIEKDEDGETVMDCTCPCMFNCKHMYATLLAIKDGKYETIKLLPVVHSKKYDIQEVMKDVPDSEIKDYFISKMPLLGIQAEIDFKEKFPKYFPLNEYEYYYNNLYNEVKLERDYLSILEDYSEDMKKYLEDKNYAQVFIIFKAIVDIMIEFNYLVYNKAIILYLNEIAIYIRIAYRQANKKIKKEIEVYTDKIMKKDNLNIYIEDIIMNNILIYKNK